MCDFCTNRMFACIVANACAGSILCFHQALDVGGWYSTDVSEFVLPRKLFRSSLLHVGCKRGWLYCSSSVSSDTSNEVSPERLWEVQLIVFYLLIYNNIYYSVSRAVTMMCSNLY